MNPPAPCSTRIRPFARYTDRCSADGRRSTRAIDSGPASVLTTQKLKRTNSQRVPGSRNLRSSRGADHSRAAKTKLKHHGAPIRGRGFDGGGTPPRRRRHFHLIQFISISFLLIPEEKSGLLRLLALIDLGPDCGDYEDGVLMGALWRRSLVS